MREHSSRVDLNSLYRQTASMTGNKLRSVTSVNLSSNPSLADALLALNNANAQELSWLDAARMKHLVGEAFAVRRIGQVEAFVLALDHTADYDSPNFRWFCDRYARFVYVDRIVVSASARGRGYARGLYEEIFWLAIKAGHDRLFCEVNMIPPNPGSDAFHGSLGFSEIGQADVDSRTVRYLSRPLPPRENAGAL